MSIVKVFKLFKEYPKRHILVGPDSKSWYQWKKSAEAYLKNDEILIGVQIHNGELTLISKVK